MFLETIRISNGVVHNLRYHQYRLNKTILDHYGIHHKGYVLSDIIQVPSGLKKGEVKCRVVFGESQIEVTFLPYIVKKIESLKRLTVEDLNYNYKYADRSSLSKLTEKKGRCDDILIVINGMITDTSYANIAFVKDGVYYTPKEPLLKGTARMRLLSQGKLIEENISNILDYDYATIFNSMVSIDKIKINIDNID